MTDKWAWRSPSGEKSRFEPFEPPCKWYYSADKGMEEELVLVYSVENSPDKKSTSISQYDRDLQTMTGSGRQCTGKIGPFAKIANPGTYNPNGTFITTL